MTALTDRAAKPRKSESRPQGSALPHVNLLPPEVHASRALSRTKHRLVFVLIGALVLVGGGYAYGVIETMSANSQLASAQQDAQTLQTQVNTYAEVPQVLNQVAEVTRARASAMSDDIVWRSYVDAIAAVLPAGVSIDSLTVTGPDPQTTSSASAGTNLLGTSGIGTIAFTARSLTVPDTAAWVDAMASVPGVTAATVGSVAIAADDSGTTYYTVTMQASLTSAALSHRFDAKTGK